MNWHVLLERTLLKLPPTIVMQQSMVIRGSLSQRLLSYRLLRSNLVNFSRIS